MNIIISIVEMTAKFFLEVANKALQIAGCIATGASIVILGHLDEPVSLQYLFPSEIWNSPDFKIGIVLFSAWYIATMISRLAE